MRCGATRCNSSRHVVTRCVVTRRVVAPSRRQWLQLYYYCYYYYYDFSLTKASATVVVCHANEVLYYPTARNVFTNFRENFREVFGRKRPRKVLEMIAFIAAIDSVKFSSKSEPSSRFFGRLKFSVSAKKFRKKIDVFLFSTDF